MTAGKLIFYKGRFRKCPTCAAEVTNVVPLAPADQVGEVVLLKLLPCDHEVWTTVREVSQL